HKTPSLGLEVVSVYLICQSGDISISTCAKYGRSDRTTCSEGIPDYQTKNTDCAMSADLVFLRCDGESECPFFVSSSVLGDPCVGTFKYLEVKYVCYSSLVTCEGSISHIQCENGVIYVSSAKYGRRDRRTCSTGITDDQRRRTNCSTRANYVFRSCHGKSECSILVSSSVFGDPCIGTYKYLEVNYRCQR
uniref:SUEL-type lectin domain-containing protein n=1 Tax=Poecilia reticulata TaxID=8081 RepID=A0A3P9N2R1_POERE